MEPNEQDIFLFLSHGAAVVAGALVGCGLLWLNLDRISQWAGACQ